MQRSRIVLPLLAVVLVGSLVGWVVLSPADSPTLTVENQDSTQYQLTVYAVPNVDGLNDLTFKATTKNGARHTVPFGYLQSGAPFRNVTLVEEAARSQQHLIPASGNFSITVGIWNPGMMTVYVIETTDGTKSLVGLKVDFCKSGGQKLRITISNGFVPQSSSTCSHSWERFIQ